MSGLVVTSRPPHPQCPPEGFIANQFALASGKKKAEGCRTSSGGFSLHDSRDCLFCLTHVQTDLRYSTKSSSTRVCFGMVNAQVNILGMLSICKRIT